MTDGGVISRADTEGRADRVQEAATMAFYVAICLLSVLTAVGEDEEQVNLLAIVWGTTVGLAMAHWFAFRLSARLLTGGRLSADDAALAGAQIGGAAAVAVVATGAVLLFPSSYELDVVLLLLGALLAAAGYGVARRAGARPALALVYAGGILVAATAIAVVKYSLGHH